MHSIIQDLNWRYATKKFDPSKKLSSEQLDIIKESLRLTASSYGMQAYTILVIENPELREKLVAASYGQRPVADASHLIVFCAVDDVTDAEVDAYMTRIATARNVDLEALQGFSNNIRSTMKMKGSEFAKNWSSRQTYIALGQLLSTCATLRVDALPMEGFDPKAYGEILNLSEKGITASVVCPIGFRHHEDANQHNKKVRKSLEELFIHI